MELKIDEQGYMCHFEILTHIPYEGLGTFELPCHLDRVVIWHIAAPNYELVDSFHKLTVVGPLNLS